MTTAHRPTFDPARGKDAQRGPAYHQRLQPAHTHLKLRQAGQGGAADAQRDLRAELLRAEASARARKAGGSIEGTTTKTTENDAENAERGTKRKLLDSADAEEAAEEDEEMKRRRLILEEAHDVDADSDGPADSSDDSSDEEDDDDEEEEEEAKLRREMEKIRAERAAKKAAEEAEQAAKEQEQREEDIARGNPLLNSERDFGVKRRWDDDVVFKNQARGTEEKGKRKEFVNDLLRSDFHKRFMVRCCYVWLLAKSLTGLQSKYVR